jgi:hypothetical protein
MAACSGAYNAVIGVDHLKKLTNDKRHRLDTLDLLLRSQKLSLQVFGLDLDIFLLGVCKN